METRKKRNRALSVVIAASLGLLIMGILTYHSDEYVSSWMISVSQAVCALAIFRLPYIKEKQRQSKIIWIVLWVMVVIGAGITLLGVLTQQLRCSLMGSFITSLGLNALVCYVANFFDDVDAREDQESQS